MARVSKGAQERAYRNNKGIGTDEGREPQWVTPAYIQQQMDKTRADGHNVTVETDPTSMESFAETCDWIINDKLRDFSVIRGPGLLITDRGAVAAVHAADERANDEQRDALLAIAASTAGQFIAPNTHSNPNKQCAIDQAICTLSGKGFDGTTYEDSQRFAVASIKTYVCDSGKTSVLNMPQDAYIYSMIIECKDGRGGFAVIVAGAQNGQPYPIPNVPVTPDSKVNFVELVKTEAVAS